MMMHFKKPEKSVLTTKNENENENENEKQEDCVRADIGRGGDVRRVQRCNDSVSCAGNMALRCLTLRQVGRMRLQLRRARSRLLGAGPANNWLRRRIGLDVLDQRCM
jgi:hypothetical protein